METASETFQAVANRMKEAQEMEAQLKMEVEEAETLAREETQKYANKLQALFKKMKFFVKKTKITGNCACGQRAIHA